MDKLYIYKTTHLGDKVAKVCSFVLFSGGGSLASHSSLPHIRQVTQRIMNSNMNIESLRSSQKGRCPFNPLRGRFAPLAEFAFLDVKDVIKTSKRV